MDELLPDVFRTLSGLIGKYGLVVIIPMLIVAICVIFPRGSMRWASLVIVAVFVALFVFGDHPAIAPVNSAVGSVLYSFRSMLQ